MTATPHADPPAASPHTPRRDRSSGPQADGTEAQGVLPPGRIEGLDGLRALAVLAVLAYHLWPQAIPGGFVGVDIFFVISGFLITTLLLRELDSSGRVDLRRFWVRRARRLLPALAVVVVAAIAAAWIAGGDLLVGIERQTLGALTFSTNWLDIAAGTDYFDQSSQPLFLTFWSLAVEEQFYLFWPPAVVAVAALRWHHLRSARVAAALAGVSALAMALLVDGSEPTRVYYGTDTHAFGLMAGVAVAFAFAGAAPLLAGPTWQRARRWLPFVGVFVFAALVAALDSASTVTYRGGLVLASVAGVLMVASLPGPPDLFTELMRLRPLAWVGERSYGLYLWHWPILLIVGELRTDADPTVDADALTAATVVLVTLVATEASYRWIEAPIRANGYRATAAGVLDRLRRPAHGHGRGPGPILAWPRVAAVAGIAVLFMAAAGLATAPARTEVETAVEEGQALIEAQTPPRRFDEPGAGTGPEAVPRPGDPAPADGGPTPGTEPARGGSTEPAWSPKRRLPPGSRMVGLGDSVMSGAAPALFRRFDGIYLDATPNLQWRDAPAMVERLVREGSMRPVVVLGFGTNAGLESRESIDALRATLEAIGPERRVVLVDVVGISYWVPSTNEKLREIAAEHPNVVVAGWNAVTRNDPGLLHDDRTHPNIDGIEAYADVVADALRRLGPG
jgi:peptidoglycan/LPS O-acetylase OafA/YrhL